MMTEFVSRMTLEDEEKDAMAGWRPVLACVGCCACFGLIVRLYDWLYDAIPQPSTVPSVALPAPALRRTRDLGIRLCSLTFCSRQLPHSLLKIVYTQRPRSSGHPCLRAALHKAWISKMLPIPACEKIHHQRTAIPKTLESALSSDA
jgi:hypothetical protein